MATASLFNPCSKRAQAFDQIMRDQLAGSLEYLAEVTREQLNISQSRLAEKLAVLRKKPVLPEVIAAYHELVATVQDGDLKETQVLFELILNTIGEDTSFRVIPLKDPATDKISDLYLTQIDSDSSTPFEAFPAKPDDFQKAETLIHESLTLLSEASPDLHDEIRALLKRVMLAAGPTEKNAFTFDGASAFGLWGAILLNAIEPLDLVDMVQTLAHESCHNLLFGYCIDGQLVENSEDELHASPLRVDPRPIDGIYHATFVVARMHYSIQQISKSPQLSDILKNKIKDESQQRINNFYDGLATLKAHARYTDEGQALMDAAEAYMDQANRN